MAEEFQIGDVVDVNGERAIVRFVGETAFAPGEWVGVELPTPDGKNDGSLNGIRYFDCPDRHGKFFRPTIPRLIERPNKQTSRTATTRTSTGPAVSVNNPPRNGTPTNISRSSPTGVAGPRSSTPARSSTSAHPSGPRAAHLSINSSNQSMPPRPGSGASTSGSRTPVSEAPPTVTAKTPTGKLSATVKAIGAVNAMQRKSATGSATSEIASSDGVGSRASMSKSHGRKDSVRGGGPTLQSSAGRASMGDISETQDTLKQQAATSSREIDDLKAKIRVLEKKRLEDREKLQGMERLQMERDKFESVIQKMQMKYQPQQEELRELRKQLKDAQNVLEELELSKSEHEVIVEMATLEREMAEEQVEYLKTELEVLRARSEELEMELELLKEENDELSEDVNPEEKSSAGWLQMAKQNERLKDALLRLKEITQQTEMELRNHIKSLEEDNERFSLYKQQYEGTKDQLERAEAVVEDLRQQLDAALGAEEMLEELTERNLSMNEQIEELTTTIGDLESLKELLEELEVNHVETEKQMQEEIDFKDQIIADQARRIAQLDASNEEAEYTITKFRGLVNNLQNDLEDMKASQQITEAEAEELGSKSRSMLDMNLKLQLTAAKAQNKTIDLELRRMEAEEAMENLQIVQMFLPSSFLTDRESIATLLRFKRVAFKCRLLHGFIKERMNGYTDHANQDDTLFAACDISDKLTWVSAMCDRFVHVLSCCNVEKFARFSEVLHELDPVERAFNGWIDALRRDELKERQCATDLQRTMAVIAHLGEIHLSESLENYAESLQMKVQMMQSHLESSAAAVSHLKNVVSKKFIPSMDEEEVAAMFMKKADAIVSHCRNAKVVVGKILRSLQDLKARSLSLNMDTKDSFEDSESIALKLARYSRTLGERVLERLNTNQDGTEVISYASLQDVMYATSEKEYTVAESDIFGVLGRELRTLTNNLMDLGSVASDLDMTTEVERTPAPWVVRMQELKNTKVVNTDVEDELRRLKEDAVERATQIKIRDHRLDEAAVKIELLEARMRNISKQSEEIESLKHTLQEAAARGATLQTTIDQLNTELLNAEKEITKWKKAADTKHTVASEFERVGSERAVATAREVQTLNSELESLKTAVAFLREENARFTRVDLSGPNSWLFNPIKPASKTKSQIAKDELTRESKDLIGELIGLATESQLIDLKSSSTSRKSWKPLKETSAYLYWKQREQYEALIGWTDSILGRTKQLEDNEGTGSKPMSKAESKAHKVEKPVGNQCNDPIARLDVYNLYPGLELKRGIAPKVEVFLQEPDAWDSMHEIMGIS